MAFELPKLPYAKNALEPYISEKTLDYHYGKHHQAYVNNVNNLIKGTEFENATLEEIIVKADGGIFNNAAQVWNHTFYFNQFCKDGCNEPKDNLIEAIKAKFGSFETFTEQFSKAAATLFGAGWAWLVVADGKLVVTSTPNQDNPLMDVAEVKGTPILGLDVWEHAYYLNYQNRRPDYISAFWNVVNWNEVSRRFDEAK
jgi:Fe-Mn family superoxide dismutase